MSNNKGAPKDALAYVVFEEALLHFDVEACLHAHARVASRLHFKVVLPCSSWYSDRLAERIECTELHRPNDGFSRLIDELKLSGGDAVFIGYCTFHHDL